jgi:hypothetical protein
MTEPPYNRCSPKMEDIIADAIDEARYHHPIYRRERDRPFSEADRSDREYALRLARAVMKALPAAHGDVDALRKYLMQIYAAAGLSPESPRPLDQFITERLSLSSAETARWRDSHALNLGWEIRARAAEARLADEAVDKATAWDTIIKAREDEREACAKVAEKAGCGDPKCMGCYGNQIAAQIRDRVGGA